MTLTNPQFHTISLMLCKRECPYLTITPINPTRYKLYKCQLQYDSYLEEYVRIYECIEDYGKF